MVTRRTIVTNLEKIKIALCNSISAMSEDVLFEFLSEYDEDGTTYFSREALFTCKQCCELYGKCEAYNSDLVNYDICKSRFHTYCNSKSLS